MKKSKEELLLEGFKMNDAGYEKDYKGLNGEPVLVAFNNIDSCVVVFKDMNDTSTYLSGDKYLEYQNKYTDEEGYGLFFETYVEGGKYTEYVVSPSNENIVLNTVANNIFSKDVTAQIKKDFLDILR